MDFEKTDAFSVFPFDELPLPVNAAAKHSAEVSASDSLALQMKPIRVKPTIAF